MAPKEETIGLKELQFDRERDVPTLAKLAERNVRIGTSSWNYPGWVGKVYMDDYSGPRSSFVKSKFEKGHVREVTRVFPTVCYDGGYYRIPSDETLRRYAEDMPENARMAIKVTDQITQRYFNQGPQRGEFNPGYLDARTFTEHFLPVVTECLGAKLGPIIFEFSPFHFGGYLAKDDYKPIEFVKDLHRFLTAIPHGEHKYAVEVRDPVLIAPEFGRYTDCLEYHGVAHVLNEQTWMPELKDQLDLPGMFPTNFTVVRALVRPGVSHEEAVKEFAPYTNIKRPLPELRFALAEIIQHTLENRRGLYMYVNNRTEGNAPDTIANVLGLLEQRFAPSSPKGAC